MMTHTRESAANYYLGFAGRGDLDDCVNCRLGLAGAVEQQRMIYPAPHVQPRIPVRDTPKSHQGNVIVVFDKHAKKIGVTFGQRLLDDGGKPLV